jgi:hypothetical protein
MTATDTDRDDWWTADQCAEHAGIATASWRAAVARGYAERRSGWDPRTGARLWHRAAAEEYAATRRQGRRTDREVHVPYVGGVLDGQAIAMTRTEIRQSRDRVVWHDPADIGSRYLLVDDDTDPIRWEVDPLPAWHYLGAGDPALEGHRVRQEAESTCVLCGTWDSRPVHPTTAPSGAAVPVHSECRADADNRAWERAWAASVD